jgi:hypothetical protein
MDKTGKNKMLLGLKDLEGVSLPQMMVYRWNERRNDKKKGKK